MQIFFNDDALLVSEQSVEVISKAVQRRVKRYLIKVACPLGGIIKTRARLRPIGPSCRKR